MLEVLFAALLTLQNPAPPVALTATAQTAVDVKLTWEPSTASGINKIYKGGLQLDADGNTICGGWQLIGQSVLPAYLDSTLQLHQTLCYAVSVLHLEDGKDINTGELIHISVESALSDALIVVLN